MLLVEVLSCHGLVEELIGLLEEGVNWLIFLCKET